MRIRIRYVYMSRPNASVIVASEEECEIGVIRSTDFAEKDVLFHRGLMRGICARRELVGLDVCGVYGDGLEKECGVTERGGRRSP